MSSSRFDDDNKSQNVGDGKNELYDVYIYQHFLFYLVNFPPWTTTTGCDSLAETQMMTRSFNVLETKWGMLSWPT